MSAAAVSPTAAPLAPAVPPVLRGVKVVTLAPNLPGPAAVMRLAAMGASCLKLEGPGGDPMRHYAPSFYTALHEGVAVEALDLKQAAGQARLHDVLAASDVLVTSSRPSALARLGIDEPQLAARHPHLAWVAIVGDHAPLDEVPGHDLTYLAESGLVNENLPPTLWADMTGSLMAVEAVLQAVLLQRAGLAGGDTSPAHLRVALGAAARYAALPRIHGITAPGRLLGGAFPGYQVFACANGQVALAALEPHFLARWQTVCGQNPQTPAAEQIMHSAAWCQSRTVEALNALARTHDVPLYAWTP